MKVILDTNFIIYCVKNKLDYVSEIEMLLNEKYELVVPVQVIGELKKVSEKQKTKIPVEKRSSRFKKTTGKDKAAALLSLQLLEKYVNENKIKKIDLKSKSVDESIIKLAKIDKKNIVCTLDREMRHELPRVILVTRQGKLMITR